MKQKIDLISARNRGSSQSRTTLKRKLSLIKDSKPHFRALMQPEDNSPPSNPFGCISGREWGKSRIET